MITINNILKRKKIMNEEKTTDLLSFNNSINYGLKDNNSLRFFEEAFNNWKSTSSSEKVSLKHLLLLCREKESMNESFSVPMRNLIKTKVVPSIKSINECADELLNYFENDNEIRRTIREYSYMDKVLRNEAKLEKYSQFEECAKRSYTKKDDFIYCVNELCDIIEGYNMPFKTKYVVALENIYLNMKMLDNSIDGKYIVEAVTDRFAQDKDASFETMLTTLESCEILNEEDKLGAAYLTNIDTDEVIFEGKVLKNRLTGKVITLLKKSIVGIKESNPTKFILGILRSFYSRSRTNITEDIPNILSWIRVTFVLGSFAVFIPLGLVVGFIDLIISMKVKREDAKKVLEDLNKEKSQCEKKLDKLSNPKTKEKMEAYIKELDRGIEKAEEYEESLYSEVENNKRHGYDESVYIESDEECEDDDELPLVSMDIYLKDMHAKNSLYINDVLNSFVELSKSKKYIQPLGDNVSAFINTFNDKTMNKFTNVDNQIMINVADYLGATRKSELRESSMNDEEISEFIKDEIVDICNSAASCSYGPGHLVLYDGDTDLFHIYVLNYDFALFTDKDIKEEAFDTTTTKDISRFLLLTEEGCKVLESDFNYSFSNFLKDITLENTNDLLSIMKESNIVFNKNNLINMINEEKKIGKYNEDYKKINALNLLSNSVSYLPNKSTNENCLVSMIQYNDIIQTLQEGKLKNRLKLMASRAKHGVQKASDKEKLMSQQIDDLADRVIDKADFARTNINREAIIKGRVIPSFSRLIKLTLACGAAAVINPVLGAITFLGSLAASKRASKKEKQYILDEIEVELQIVEKKVQLAESNNDMKAMEKLLKIQRRLRQEKQRIVYDGKARNFVHVKD